MKCYLTVNGIFSSYQDRCMRQRIVFIECDMIVLVYKRYLGDLRGELKCAGSTITKQPENPFGFELQSSLLFSVVGAAIYWY